MDKKKLVKVYEHAKEHFMLRGKSLLWDIGTLAAYGVLGELIGYLESINDAGLGTVLALMVIRQVTKYLNRGQRIEKAIKNIKK